MPAGTANNISLPDPQHIFETRQLIELIQEGIWVIDPQGTTTYVNPRLAEMMGFAPAELIGQPLFAFLDEEAAGVCRTVLGDICENKRCQIEGHLIGKGGRRVDVLISGCPLLNSHGEYEGAMALMTDISRMKQTEKHLNLLNELTADMYVVIDGDYRIQAFNQALADELKRTHRKDIVIGSDFMTYVEPAEMEGFLQIIACALNGDNVSLEWENINSNTGLHRWYEIKLAPILNESGTVESVFIAAQDISEHKRAEMALQYRLNMQKMIATISASFIEVVPEKVDETIVAALKMIGKQAGADRCFILLLSPDESIIVQSYRWSAKDDVTSVRWLDNRPAQIYPWVRQKVILNREIIHALRVAELPPEAQVEKETWEKMGIRSELIIPLLAGERVFGMLGFNAIEREICWKDEEIEFLKTMGHVFASFLSRMKTEEALNKSQAELNRTNNLLKTVFDSAIDMIFVKDHEGRYLMANPANVKMMNMPPSAVIGHKDADIFPQDVAREYEAQDEQVYASGQAVRFEEYYPFLGKERYYSTIKSPFYDSDGNIIGLVGIAHDITEQKKAAEVLEYRLKLNELIAAVSTRFINITQEDGEIAIQEVLNSIGEFAGADRCFFRLISQEGQKLGAHLKWIEKGDQHAPRTAGAGDPLNMFPWTYNQLIRLQEPILVNRMKDLPAEAHAEKEIWQAMGVRSALIIPLISSGRTLGMLGFNTLEREVEWKLENVALLRTLGEVLVSLLLRLQAEEALRQSQAALKETTSQLETVLSNAADPIFSKDLQGRYTSINRLGAYVIGKPEAEIIGRTDREIFSVEIAAKLEKHDRRVIQKNCAVTNDEKLLVNGVERHFTVIKNPIHDENGEVIGVVGIAHDITERKQAEMALQYRLKMKELVATISSRFVSVDPSNLLEAFGSALQTIGEFNQVDRCYIRTFTEDGRFGVGYRWAKSGQLLYRNMEEGLPLSEVPWMMKQIVDQKSLVHVPSVANLPPEAVLEKAVWNRLNVKSTLAIPVISGDDVLGYMGLNMTSCERTWNNEEIELLKTMGEIFANLLVRLKAENALRESEAKFRQLAWENELLLERARQDAGVKSRLLQEVNHRVKNNLAAIIGLLYAEQRNASDEEKPFYVRIVKEMVGHIDGLVLVHNMLSDSEWAPIRLDKLAQTIVEGAVKILPGEKKASIEVTPSAVRVDSRQANSLGLILNELATNTVKHGQSDGVSIEIKISIIQKNQDITLEYRDNGPGYPADVLSFLKHRTGLYLIQTIVAHDMQGKLTIANENGGAVTRICFKLDSVQ
jgi:PAS domain S-box-containing protein